eukprot:TRINITY_DN3028_c0_g1_i4.p1 TRINITY_DN3028_c0_g1~~TRINITY_DN3028_c0_g1_i4.p1  ORF type:complete len:235 (-),score=41.29 TRINITY_DN3028_c0_g1_i4:912-1616(-)
MTVVQLYDWQLLACVAVAFLPVLVVILVQSRFDYSEVKYEFFAGSAHSAPWRVAFCSAPTYYGAFIILYLLFMVLVGIYLAIRTRKVPGEFNESKIVGGAIYASFLIGLILAVLETVIDANVSATLVLRSMALLLGPFILLTILFVPKMSAIWYPESFKVFRHSSQDTNSNHSATTTTTTQERSRERRYSIPQTPDQAGRPILTNNFLGRIHPSLASTASTSGHSGHSPTPSKE